MEASEFPDCCAVNILSNFGDDGDLQLPVGSLGEEELDELESFIEELSEQINGFGRRTLTIAITSDKDQKNISAILKEFGFSASKHFKNRATRNLLTMWEFLLERSKVAKLNKVRNKYFNSIEKQREKLHKEIIRES